MTVTAEAAEAAEAKQAPEGGGDSHHEASEVTETAAAMTKLQGYTRLAV